MSPPEVWQGMLPAFLRRNDEGIVLRLPVHGAFNVWLSMVIQTPTF